jgi:hypothetical protein
MADPSFRQWWRMYNLSAITAPEAYDMVLVLGPVDIRRLLGSIRVPTLLLHRSGDQWVDVHTQPLHGRTHPRGQTGRAARR